MIDFSVTYENLSTFFLLQITSDTGNLIIKLLFYFIIEMLYYKYTI